MSGEKASSHEDRTWEHHEQIQKFLSEIQTPLSELAEPLVRVCIRGWSGWSCNGQVLDLGEIQDLPNQVNSFFTEEGGKIMCYSLSVLLCSSCKEVPGHQFLDLRRKYCRTTAGEKKKTDVTVIFKGTQTWKVERTNVVFRSPFFFPLPVTW